MSPEQADGRLDQVTPASDVYSLGATLHCLLTGRPPHDNCDLSAIRERFREGHVCRPSEVSRHVPRALEAICVKAMAIRPQQRYDSVRALAADVERWLADEPVTAWHEPRIIRIARWARRHQSVMAATVAAVVVGLVGLAAASHLLASARIERHVSQARLEQAEADAERQKQLANQLFHREHAFIEKYSSGFDGTTALDPSQSFSLEKKLFEMVHDHYRDYVAEAPLHDVSPADIATAYYRLGMVCSMQGDLPAAINAHQEGIEIQRQLASQRPNDRRLRRDLAKSLRELAPLHFMSRDLQASKAMLNEALAIHREMVGQIPDNTDDRCGVAICQHFLATVHHAEGDAETARQINQEAIDLLAPMTAEELADDEHPENVRFCLVSCYRLHAQLLQAAGHHQEALRATQAASRLKDELGRSMSRRMREALRPLSPMEVGPPAPFSSNPPTSLWESIRDLLPKRRVHRDAEQGDEAPDVGAP